MLLVTPRTRVLFLAKPFYFRLGVVVSTSNYGAPPMATAQPTVTLKQISADIAEKYDLSKKLANEILSDTLVSLIVKNLKKGNRIRIAGLGILQVKKRAARTGRNPATGETIQIPAKKKIAFRAAKELKEAVGK
jgi:DNA-binding protein HU-beta